MKKRLLAACLIALFVALFAREAAADRAAIVRVRSSNAALDERLAAEIATLGFDVKDVEASAPGAALDAIARANGAVAVVRADEEGAIELWVAAPNGQDPPVHEIIRDPHRGRNVVTVLALESLRAHLIAVRRDEAPAPAPSPAPAPAPSPPIVLAPPREPWLWLHLAVAADASPGGLSPAADVLGELRVEPRAWIALSAFAAVSPTTAQLAGPEGGTSVHRSIAGAAADVQGRVGDTTLSLGAGAALVAMSLRGYGAAAGYVGQDASILTAGPMLRACGAFAIAPALRVRTELTSGLTFPRASVTFAGREVAAWGRPFGLLTLGMEWGALK